MRPVTDDLRNHRGARDRVDAPVAVHDGVVGTPEGAHGESVDHDVFGSTWQVRERAAHGERGRLEHVEPVNLAHRRGSDRHRVRPREHVRVDAHARGGTEPLRIGRTGDRDARPENHGGGDHRTGERSPPHLVHPRHAENAAAPEPPLVGEDILEPEIHR